MKHLTEEEFNEVVGDLLLILEQLGWSLAVCTRSEDDITHLVIGEEEKIHELQPYEGDYEIWEPQTPEFH